MTVEPDVAQKRALVNAHVRGIRPTDRIDLTRLLFLAEGVRRGLAIELLSDDQVFRVSAGSCGFIFQFWPGYLSARQRSEFSDLSDKQYQKPLLRACGLPVPQLYQVVTTSVHIDLAKVQFPAVVKPRAGVYSGQNVAVHIETVERLRESVDRVASGGQHSVIEQHVSGQHYRILVVGGRYISCIERRAANVVGDGIHTVDELITSKNTESGRGPRTDPRHMIHYLVVDEAVVARQGYSRASVPPMGAAVALQDSIVGSLGADFIDYTDCLHPETIARCEAFARKHSLVVVGFDFITPALTESCVDVGAFNEVNVRNVVTSCNERPNVGSGRPVAAAVWDSIDFSAVAHAGYPVY